MTRDQHIQIGRILGFPECCVLAWVDDPEPGQALRRGSITERRRTPAECARLDAQVSALLGRPWDGCRPDPYVKYVPCEACRVRHLTPALDTVRGL